MSSLAVSKPIHEFKKLLYLCIYACIIYVYIFETSPFEKMKDSQIVAKKDTGESLPPLPKLPHMLTLCNYGPILKPEY